MYFISRKTILLSVLSIVVLLLVLLPEASHCQQQGQQPTHRTPSFEDTIDEFLRQAQDSGDATDIQVSTCKISSQELVATAQATAARVLKGVCNPSEIEDRFHNMEVQLGDQLNVVKAMLLSLEEKLVEQDQELKRQYRRLLSSVGGVRQKSGGANSGSSSGLEQPYSSSSPSSSSSSYSNQVSRRGTTTQATYTEDLSDDDDEDGGNDSPVVNAKSGLVGPRSDEISRYNSTVHIEGGRRVFSYYWIITGMSYKLNNWNQRRSLRSNSFHIYPGGYRMYMKIIPRYTASAMYVHVGITKGEFDDSLRWPFTYLMRAQVLAQDDARNKATDLKSRIWNPRELCSGSNWRKPVSGDNPECVGLGFPHEVIKTADYIWNDRIIVKLTVYLD